MVAPHPGSARGLTALEDLRLQDIPDDGLRFDEAVPEAWLAPRIEGGHGLQWTLRGPGHLDLEVDALGPVDQAPPVRVHGSLRCEVSTECVRCLEAVHHDLRVQVDVTLFSDREDTPEDPATPGIEEGRYERDTVPLPEIIRENVLLELDMNPVCSDVDACDTRTKALIAEANAPAERMKAEAETAIDPRWAPLARLKSGDPD